LAAAVVPGGDGDTGLHLAAQFCALDQIAGGVSIQQLHSVKNRSGQTPLEIAADSRQLFDLIGPDPIVYWRALQPGEQEMLRQVLANRQIPAEIVNIVGSGIAAPVIDFQPDGTVTFLDLTADNQVFDSLPATRSLNRLELQYPISTPLTCQRCHKTSRVSIRDEFSHRHPCPHCGTIHYFSPELYELEAIHRIKSLRHVFPLCLEHDCNCGCKSETTVTDRNQKAVCPDCAAETDLNLPQWEEHLVGQLKRVFSQGVNPGGWSATPIDPPQIQKLALARTNQPHAPALQPAASAPGLEMNA